MNVTLETSAVRDAMRAVSGAAAARSQNAALKCALLDARDGRVAFRCSDLDVVSEYVADAEVREAGSIAIPVSGLVSWCGAASDRTTRVEVDRQHVVLRNGKNMTRLHCLSGDDFPRASTVDGKAWRVGGDVLRRLLSATAPFTSTDASRAVLGAVHLVVAQGTATAEATDGKVLSRIALDAGGAPDLDVLVPSRLANELLRLVDDGEVDALVGSSHASFRSSSWILGGRLLDGRFPDTSRVIPDESATSFSVERDELLHAVQRVSRAVRDDDAPMLMHVCGGVVRLSISGDGGTAEDSLHDVAMTGREARVGMNPRFLERLLSRLDAESVSVGVGGPSDPITLRAGPQTMVLMPMRSA